MSKATYTMQDQILRTLTSGYSVWLKDEEMKWGKKNVLIFKKLAQTKHNTALTDPQLEASVENNCN